MKNLISFLIYDDAERKYELIANSSGIDLESEILSFNKRVSKKIYDEIDLIKKRELRRMSTPFKDNRQRYT